LTLEGKRLTVADVLTDVDTKSKQCHNMNT